MALVNSITELVGNTPLLHLHKLSDGLPGNVIVKLENFNPLSSVKDRIGKAMIEAAERDGLLTEKSVIIEPTSGNTGIALAFVCAAKGYRLILTMPESMSIERRKLLRALGAELVLTPGDKGMPGAIDKAGELKKQYENSFIPQQFKNRANPEIHIKTTAEEIWKDSEGRVDIFIAGVGTGGTVSGVGAALKNKNPAVQVFAVEPVESPVISGGKAGPHKIQGIGAGFIPDVLNREILDGVITVKAEDAADTARLLAKMEGVLGGISAGANVQAALGEAGKEENRDKNIVTVICDTGERYLSTWLWEI
jgi:cysteine synthase A